MPDSSIGPSIPRPLVHRPPLEAAPRPCAWCERLFTPPPRSRPTLAPDCCSAACTHRYRTALETGTKSPTPFPGITSDDHPLPRCRACHTWLITPASQARNRCLPCETYRRTAAAARAHAKQTAALRKQLDAHRAFEKINPLFPEERSDRNP